MVFSKQKRPNKKAYRRLRDVKLNPGIIGQHVLTSKSTKKTVICLTEISSHLTFVVSPVKFLDVRLVKLQTLLS